MDGNIYYESCNGNSDTGCVNVDSFHFRHDGVAPPNKLSDFTKNKRTHIEDSRTFLDKVVDVASCLGACFIMMLGITAIAISIVGFISFMGEAGIGLLIGGIIGSLIFGCESSYNNTSEGSWFDTFANCDD